jgi:tetratricopeptide (TPR) repeat protein
MVETGQSATGLVEKAYGKLKDSDAVAACLFLEQALKIEFWNDEIKHALKCVRWWIDNTSRIADIAAFYEKGGGILSLWKKYHVFLRQFDRVYDRCQYAVRCFVFSSALIYFRGLLGNQANQHDPGLLLLVGRCYKGLGNYIKALEYLEQAVRFKREDADTLAEVADVNALLAETKAAKALFREAFFLDPAKIDMLYLESELILKLKDEVAALGYAEEELCEWIPVFGYLWGVFSIKRELKQVEAGRLKQSVFSMESERDANPARSSLIKPRLLNRYFWLIDHYESSREDPAMIEEVLLKIKVTDPDIYQRYTR